MKTKLVIWGTNAADEKTLIAMELRADKNQVGVWMFPEKVVTDAFSEQLFEEWRNGKEVPFPEEFTYVDRELTVTDSLLPDDLKVERSDLIMRAQAEWHFIVLSTKLRQAYHAELDDIKARVEKLESFDNQVWDSLKEFWEKVQKQVNDRNLFREHIENLREGTNALFTRMKELRNKKDEDFHRRSKEVMSKFMDSLQAVEDRIKEGLRLQSLFDELKKIQQLYRESEMTREHRNKVWDRIDAAFKALKDKRFGGGSTQSTSASGGGDEGAPMDRLQKRYDGLMDAIDKMLRSIKRDQDDLNFQQKKIETTDGQLEAQIRQAKIKMIEERIKSKEEKLKEMNQTREELDKRREQIQAKEEKRAEREKFEQAKEAAKEKIAEQMRQQTESRSAMADQLEKAAEALGAKKSAPEVEIPQEEKKEDLIDTITEMAAEAMEDVSDTVRAVAGVVGKKISEAVEDLTQKEEEKPAETAPEGSEPTPEPEAKKEDLIDSITEAMENAGEKVMAAAGAAGKKIKEAIEDLTKKEEEKPSEPPVEIPVEGPEDKAETEEKKEAEEEDLKDNS